MDLLGWPFGRGSPRGFSRGLQSKSTPPPFVIANPFIITPLCERERERVGHSGRRAREKERERDREGERERGGERPAERESGTNRHCGRVVGSS